MTQAIYGNPELWGLVSSTGGVSLATFVSHLYTHVIAYEYYTMPDKLTIRPRESRTPGHPDTIGTSAVKESNPLEPPNKEQQNLKR